MKNKCFICKNTIEDDQYIKLVDTYICSSCYEEYSKYDIDNRLECSSCGCTDSANNIIKIYDSKPLCLSCYNALNKVNTENEKITNTNKILKKDLTPYNYSVEKTSKPKAEVQEYCDQISECSNKSKPIKPEIFYWLYKKYNKDLKTLSRMFKVTIRTLERWMEIYRTDNK